MAKLYFYYSTMNAGKSTTLIQSAYNYHERNMQTLVFTAALDDRYQKGKVVSRVGIEIPALLFDEKTDFLSLLKGSKEKIDCVLIDEAQFLEKNMFTN
ncbi:MAG: hypothetical protein N4Q30_03620 [Neisseriaceae bacterium]|nr:hypothetical protein [Neisseriaceae bacterium]